MEKEEFKEEVGNHSTRAAEDKTKWKGVIICCALTTLQGYEILSNHTSLAHLSVSPAGVVGWCDGPG